MADIRIKDLTTTASTTAADDFFAADGATNGTRKLSAYSPTFGGNATVGGTLTVTGNTTLSGNLDVASGISTGTAQLQIGNGRTGSGYAYVDLVGDTTYSDYGFRIIRNNGGANTSSELAHRGTGDFALVANDAAPIKFYTNGVTAATIAATTGNTTIHSTSASTSTSSGALVVGNGTSGGLGVGGAIYAGDTIETTSGSNRIVLGATNYIWHYRSGADGQLRLTRAGVSDWDFKGGTNLTIASDGTTVFTLTSTGNATVGGTLTVSGASVFQGAEGVTTGVTSSFASSVTNAITGDVLYWGSASRGGLLRGYHDGGGTVQWQFGRYTASAFAEYLRLAGNTAANAVLTLYGTTASTSTSSGALVVSGGVGVAKSINAGTTGADHSHVFTGGDGGSGSTIFAIKDYFGTTKFLVDGTGGIQAGGSLSLTGASNVFRIVNSQTPASASATGTAGTIAWDSSYIYVCTATNTWKRVAIATW